MLKIIEVKPRRNHTITIYLSNGSVVTLDMTIKLHTARYAGLADENLFMKAVTDGQFVRWKPTIEMSIRDILDVAGSVVNQYTDGTDEPWA
ncbi:MAG: DUF2442 domain-containing protein [Clostridiales bacterium]|jgi:hypothetical protein|nr:DUF2442 domain-containing protein [Clostridiales bacterium]